MRLVARRGRGDSGCAARSDRLAASGGGGGAAPHLVLILGVVWTVAAGVESGLVWAVAGGLALDVLAQRPLGILGLRPACLPGCGRDARPSAVGDQAGLPKIPLVLLLSFLNSLLLVAYGALRAPIPDPDPLRSLLPGVLYDALLAAPWWAR